MSGLLNMVNSVKTILAEAKMKNIFDSIESGDIMVIHFKSEMKVFGSYQRFEIGAKNDIGFTVRAEVNKKQYTIHKDNISQRQIEITDEGNGKTYILPTTDISFRVAKLGGDFIRLDGKNEPVDEPVEVGWNDGDSAESKEDLNKKIIKFNDIIKSLEEDENLQIKTRIDPETGENNENVESIETVLTFLVTDVDVENNNLELTLTWAEGDKAKGYYNKLNNQEIIINLNDLIKIKRYFLTLTLTLRDSSNKLSKIALDYIDDLGSSNVDGQDRTMSKKELSKIIRNDPTILKLFNKQPNIMQTLMGASPTGVYQLGKMLQKYKINNSYLTKGKHVSFRLLSASVGDSGMGRVSIKNHKKRDETYMGTMMSSQILKYGNIGREHFKLELIKDKGNGIYDVRIKKYDTRDNVRDYGPGKIEFTDIQD